MSRESKFRAPKTANLPPTHEVPEAVDFEELCRRVISDPASTALDKFRAMDRLRQMEREESEAERRSKPLTREQQVEELADDPERLERVIQLYVEHIMYVPALRAEIERRAEELVEERALERRSESAVLDAQGAQDTPLVEGQGEEPAATPEAPRDAQGSRFVELVEDRPPLRRRHQSLDFGGYPPSRSQG